MKPYPEENSNTTSITGGISGMSRAAKKRAKKKQKTTSETNNSTLLSTTTTQTKRPLPENGNGNNDKFSTKKVKSMLQEPSYKAQNSCDDAKRKENSSSGDGRNPVKPDKDQAFVSPSITYDLPSLPSNTSVVDLLMLKDQPTNIPELAELLGSMTAKQRAACLLQSIVAPITLEEFYKEYWEKKPLHVQATDKNKSRYADLLSLESIKSMTKNHSMYYGKDLNVTKYKKGSDGIKRRFTLDKLPESNGDNNKNNNSDPEAIMAETPELWSNYDSGCTIRLLCPHKHNNAVQSLLSTLETEFQCMVGANAYLTPPRSSQGFAPHYDDIEAFCLQLQGSKRWKVYEPTLALPRTSSEDFTPEEVESLKLVMDITLEEGDLLYMPRGWIHQACTLKDNNQHSLHLTVSAMQQWAWVDFMEMVIPEALEAVALSETSTSLREGLPQGFTDYMGVMYEETNDDKLPESLKKVAEEEAAENEQKRARALLREKFRAEAKSRIMAIAKTALEMIDATCDQMGKRFISERQPPALTAMEVAMTSQEDEAADSKPILPNTLCRLVRPGIGRLVLEDDKAVVYHCADNSREYLGNPVSPMEFEMDDGPALEQLLTTVEPDWIVVNDLFHDTIEEKIAITQALYDEGILAIKHGDEEIDANAE
jgi:lysine-specific demethylase/histidyl-hydroxylase NO66